MKKLIVLGIVLALAATIGCYEPIVSESGSVYRSSDGTIRVNSDAYAIGALLAIRDSRVILSFDTSDINDASTVSAAKLALNVKRFDNTALSERDVEYLRTNLRLSLSVSTGFGDSGHDLDTDDYAAAAAPYTVFTPTNLLWENTTSSTTTIVVPFPDRCWGVGCWPLLFQLDNIHKFAGSRTQIKIYFQTNPSYKIYIIDSAGLDVQL